MDQMDKHCPMCGAKPGEPCTIISDTTQGAVGTPRPSPHFYRANDEPIGTPVKDEPPYYLSAGA